MTEEIIIDGVDVKECIFYIDHNPPEGSGTWGGAIHKGACKLNSTACKHTPQCFIKRLYKQLKRKEQECQYLKRQLEYFKDLFVDSEDKLQVKEQECESQKQRLEYYRKKTTQLLNDIDNKDRFNTELQEKIEKLEQELLYAKNIASDILSNNCNIGYARQEVAKILYTR